MTNRYGKTLEVGKAYSTNGEAKFGNDGNGFHFCKNLEDTLRYFDAFNNEVNICYVRGFGDIATYEDEYNGYYDMYSSTNIEILKKLERDEIINYVINLPEYRVSRFISLFKLTNDEIELFREKFKNSYIVNDMISYYQLKDKDVFERRM